MKRLTLKLLIAVVFLLVVSSSLLLAENEKLKVFVSILPQKYFAERLLGDNAIVDVLIGPGMSPHTYEDRKSTRLNSSHIATSRMPSSA